MNYKDFIELYSKDNLKKKERDIILNLVSDEKYIENFITSKEYLKVKDNQSNLYKNILLISLESAKLLLKYETINLKYTLPGMIFNTTIHNLKKLNQVYSFSEKDIPTLFQPANSNKPDILVINLLVRNNMSLAVDIFLNYRKNLSNEEFFYFDKTLKQNIIFEIQSNSNIKLTQSFNNILKKYPFQELGDFHYNEGTYELIRLASVYNSPFYNFDNFIEETLKTKIAEKDVIPLLSHLLFKTHKKNYYTEEFTHQQFDFILSNFIQKNTYIPNLINIINNISNQLDFDYPYKLPVLLKHFHADSFTHGLHSNNIQRDIKALHYLIENNIFPETKKEILIHYIHNFSHSNSTMDNLPYKPEYIVSILKKLSQEDILNNLDINKVMFENHRYYFDKTAVNYYNHRHNGVDKEKSEKLNNSHKLITYLFKNELYPNIQPQYLFSEQKFYDLSCINDKIIENKIKKITLNTPFYANFISDVVKEKDITFYLHKENFLKDFYNDRKNPLIERIFKSLGRNSENIFDKSTLPFFEKHLITQSLEKNINEEPSFIKNKKRI